MKDQITNITLDCMLGIREGVSKCRIEEFKSYINDLIEAKNAGLEPDTIQFPMLSDRVRQSVDASLSAKSAGGVGGGVKWTIADLSANYSKEQQQGIRVKVDMEFVSIGAPDFSTIQSMSVEELIKLLEVVNG